MESKEPTRSQRFVTAMLEQCAQDKGFAARLRRADNPDTEPYAYGILCGAPLYLTGVSGSGFSIEKTVPSEKPGTIAALDKGKGLRIATGDGYIHVNRVLPPMRKEMDAASFVNGSRDVIGRILE